MNAKPQKNPEIRYFDRCLKCGGCLKPIHHRSCDLRRCYFLPLCRFCKHNNIDLYSKYPPPFNYNNKLKHQK